MKTTLIAAAVAAAVAAAGATAQATTLWDKDGTSFGIGGRIQAAYFSKDSNLGNPSSGDGTLMGSGRLNMSGRTRLTDYMDAFAFIEWDMADGDLFTNFRTRYNWVGLDFHEYGQIKAGMYEDAFYYVQRPVDVFIYYGTVELASKDDRRKGQFMYTWQGSGVDVVVSYQTAKDGNTVDGAFWGRQSSSDGGSLSGSESLNMEQGFAVGLGYTTPDVVFGPITVRVGYGYVDFGSHVYDSGLGQNVIYGSVADGTAVSYDSYSQWGVTLAWGGPNLTGANKACDGPYIAFMYQVRSFDFTGAVDVSALHATASGTADSYDVTGMAFVIGYGFDNGIGIYTGYEYHAVEWDGTNLEAEANAIPILLNYQVTPHFRTWIEARIDIGTHDESNNVQYPHSQYAANVVSVGARFLF